MTSTARQQHACSRVDTGPQPKQTSFEFSRCPTALDQVCTNEHGEEVSKKDMDRHNGLTGKRGSRGARTTDRCPSGRRPPRVRVCHAIEKRDIRSDPDRTLTAWSSRITRH